MSSIYKIGVVLAAAAPTGGASIALAGALTKVGLATVGAGAIITTASALYASSEKYGGKTVYNKNNVRVDYECYGSNGNENVHIHSKILNHGKEAVWKITDSVKEYLNISNSASKVIRASKDVQKAIQKAIEIVLKSGGN